MKSLHRSNSLYMVRCNLRSSVPKTNRLIAGLGLVLKRALNCGEEFCSDWTKPMLNLNEKMED